MLNVVAIMFPSPYGDGTLPVNKFHDYFTFSPPYGEAGAQRLRRFCGDKLKCKIRVQRVRMDRVFAPLRGWYDYAEISSHGRCVSVPSRG